MTQQLQAWRNGDAEALESVMSLLYNDLRRIARRQLLRGRPGATLNTTALVHETYLKLVNQAQVEYQSRGHFFNLVAKAMRQIIVDYLRRRQAGKRGGDQVRVPLAEADAATCEEAEALLELDQALARLSHFDPRLGRLVECRFFAGLTEGETAEALGLSKSTVQRDWVRARAWLHHEIASGKTGSQDG
jgi:RNA polymerase sigma factor (TIGR02999 family)